MNSGDNDLLYFELVQENTEDKLLFRYEVVYFYFFLLLTVFSISD